MRKPCHRSESASTGETRPVFDADRVLRERCQAMRLDYEEWKQAESGSRAELADILSELSERRVTERSLEKWLSPRSNRPMPPWCESSWCTATRSTRIKNVDAGRLGGRFVGPDDVRLIELGKADLQAYAWGQRHRKMRDELGLEAA